MYARLQPARPFFLNSFQCLFTAASSREIATLQRGRTFIRRIATENRISVLDGRKRLRVTWTSPEGKSSTYHSVWLRHNCRCPECLSASNQTSIISYELDPHVSILHASVTEDKKVHIKWSCSHEGYLNLDWLKKHCYSSQTLEELRRSSTPTPLKPGSIPRISVEELKDDLGVLKWLKVLNEKGACLVTGVPCTTEAGLELSHKINLNLQKTLYGEQTYIKESEKPITPAYSNDGVEPHMDTIMYESFPGVIVLHCLRNDECVEGGESTVIDALAVVEKLRITHPHHFATLVRVPVTFQRINHDSDDDPAHMVYRTPHIHLDGHNQVVKLRWSPHNQGPLRVAEEDVEPYYEAYSCLAKALNSSENKFSFRLKPGDVLTLNNMRMMHGRTAIKLNGGVRILSYFSVNIDDFKSRLMVLCAKYDPEYQPKNVLNHDFSYSTAARM